MILIISIAVGMSACSSDQVAHEDGSCGVRLELVSMGGTMADIGPLTGADMDWQESIFFTSNTTFIKHRDRDGVIAEESGTYAQVALNDRNYLELTYTNAGNDLIASCTTAESKELLEATSDTELKGTWGMCDGPTLIYQKKTMRCQE